MVLLFLEKKRRKGREEEGRGEEETRESVKMSWHKENSKSINVNDV